MGTFFGDDIGGPFPLNARQYCLPLPEMPKVEGLMCYGDYFWG